MAAVTIKVRMESTAVIDRKGRKAKKNGLTGYFKTTTKNPRNHPEKMELMMYDPIVRKHVIFKEKKVK